MDSFLWFISSLISPIIFGKKLHSGALKERQFDHSCQSHQVTVRSDRVLKRKGKKTKMLLPKGRVCLFVGPVELCRTVRDAVSLSWGVAGNDFTPATTTTNRENLLLSCSWPEELTV